MTCSLANSKLVFESSGMEIAPYSIDYRSRRGRLDYAKAKVSRRAGRYISDHFDEHEPVRIEIDGHVISRMMVPENPVELGMDYGWLTLVDQRKVLTRGIIDKVFHKTTLGSVLDYIFEHTDDPSGVLTDARAADPEMEGVVTESYRSKYKWFFTSGFGEDSAAQDFYEDIGLVGAMHDTVRFIHETTGILEREGGFDFNQVTPAKALKMVEEQFNLHSWVDNEGVLWIGIQDVQADFFYAGMGSDTFRIKSYNITEDAVPVQSVVAKGTYKVLVEGDYYGGPVGDLEEKKLQSWAIARWTRANGGRQIPLGKPKKIISGRDLALLAATRLREEIHDSKGGQLVLNPLASGDDHGHPTEMVVGDHIGVIGMFDDDCSQTWDSDLFTINGIHHRIGDNGWEISLDVGKIIAGDEIEVSFWYFDPTSQETYTPEEVYNMSLTTSDGQ